VFRGTDLTPFQSVAVLIGQQNREGEAMTEAGDFVTREDVAILNLIWGGVSTNEAVSWAVLGRVEAGFVTRVKRLRAIVETDLYPLGVEITCENHCGPIKEVPCESCRNEGLRMRFSVEGYNLEKELERLAELKETLLQRQEKLRAKEIERKTIDNF
jgi:hypothetical protein